MSENESIDNLQPGDELRFHGLRLGRGPILTRVRRRSDRFVICDYRVGGVDRHLSVDLEERTRRPVPKNRAGDQASTRWCGSCWMTWRLGGCPPRRRRYRWTSSCPPPWRDRGDDQPAGGQPAVRGARWPRLPERRGGDSHRRWWNVPAGRGTCRDSWRRSRLRCAPVAPDARWVPAHRLLPSLRPRVIYSDGEADLSEAALRLPGKA